MAQSWSEMHADDAVEMELLTLGDGSLGPAATSCPSGGKRGRRVASTVASLAGLACAIQWGARSSVAANAGAALVVEPQEVQRLSQSLVLPASGHCSKKYADCFATGCCKTTGYTCFTTTPGKAKCMKHCVPSAATSCAQPPSVAAFLPQEASLKGTSFYCFAVYTKGQGIDGPIRNSKFMSDELDVLRYACANKLSLFACEQSDVFSDVAVDLGGEVSSIVVTDEEGDFHAVRRPKTGGWLNTGMFTQVWKAISRGTKVQHADWIAKVDPDTVFVPGRLRRWLAPQLVPAGGLYLMNCKFVHYGLYGSLEVLSQAAFQTLTNKVDSCKRAINWRKGIWAPIGEDLFAQMCLDRHGVRHVEAWDTTADGACPGDRPHHQRKNKSWAPDCAKVAAPSMHRFKRLEDWVRCSSATIEAFGQ